MHVKAGFLRSISVVVVLAIAGIILITVEALRCTVVAAQSATQIPSTLFGMSLISGNDWPQDSVGALGKGTMVNWPYTEPQRGVFNWANLDAWVSTASSHGVDYFFSNNLIPPWAAADQSTCGPTYPGSPVTGCTSTVANIQDWDDFVTALATRYKGKMIYELWNEPNAKYYTGTVADMVTLTTHEYNIIRSIDPKALILAPSPTYSTASPATYLDQYFTAGGPTGVDVITFHGYWPDPEHVATTIGQVQAIMAKYNLSSKPLWDTEGAWNTTPPTSEQGGFVARYYLIHWSAGVSRLYWYAWDNPNYGTMWDATTGLHPDAIAYQQVYNWMVGATMSSPCTMASDSTWTCTLTRPGGYQALAIWNSATTTSYTPASQYKQYLDLTGQTNPIIGSVTIGYNPILLVSSAPPAPPTNINATVN
jgi:cellulase (glycosyl hydrolase family 5)